ncbi:MAG TPA: hypothetical protein VKB19_03100 [Pedobacter sp.]|nr:hypothetical protein [Pedobacter sp.]
MKELLKKIEEKRPEIVFEWKDKESEAEGWVVINFLRSGAAGGGTRMRKGLEKTSRIAGLDNASDVIFAALQNIHKESGMKTELSKTAFKIALKQLI